jgi:hypothetical protein
MKILIEGPFDSESTINPVVRKAFAKVNKFLTAVDEEAKFEGVPDVAYEILEKLNPDEKKGFIKIVKSLSLLTAGNVEMVRNRGKTWNRDEASSWKEVLSPVSQNILYLLDFDINSQVTAEDYKQASIHLNQIAGKSNIEFVSRFDHPMASGLDIDPGVRQRSTQRDKMRYDKKNISILYRGLHSLPESVIRYMITSKEITLPNACSSSTDLDIASSFAGKSRSAFNALLVISNPKKIGVDARQFSKFTNEHEIIIKGNFVVEAIYCKTLQTIEPPFINTALMADGQKPIFENERKKKMIELIQLGHKITDEHLDEIGQFAGRNLQKGKNLYFIFKGTLK